TRSKRDWSSDVCSSDLEVATGVARAAGGRTLVLCTSRQSVETVGQRMEEALEPEGITVLTQRPGGPSQALAKEFADNPHSVLVRSEERRVGKARSARGA